jgi:hypothetical protein
MMVGFQVLEHKINIKDPPPPENFEIISKIQLSPLNNNKWSLVIIFLTLMT